MSSLFDELMEEICEKNQKISDLEAKLAEKDKAIENWQTMYESVVQTCHNDKEEIERLNKRLAEKEKEIKAKETLNQIFKDNRENKISFCIEHLEKVKEYANKEIKELNKLLEETNDYYYYIQAVGARIYDFKRMINQQINELKGKVEDEKRN